MPVRLSRSPVKFLQNLPMLAKLVIAPASLFVLMTILALFVSNTMARTDIALNQLIDALDQKSRTLLDAQRGATELQGEMYRIVGLLSNEAEPGHLQDLAAKVQEKILSIKGELEALPGATPLTTEERKSNEDVLVALDAYLGSVRTMTDALELDFPIAIMFIVGVEQSYDRVRRNISDFSQLIRTTNQQIYDDARSRTKSSRQLIVLLVVSAVLIGGIITVLTSRMIIRPIATISSAMSRVARQGKTSLQIPETTRRDEIGSMARALEVFRDNALKIKETENQLRQAQKMEAVGKLTGGVAHDFNNLLAVIMGNAEILHLRLGEQDKRMRAIVGAASRGAELTQRLLAFSRRQPLHPQVVDLAALVAGMSDMLYRTLGETIEVKTRSEPDLWPVLVDAGQLENALLNLAINARDAMPAGGTLTIGTANIEMAEDVPALRAGVGTAAYVVLAVSDTGLGMSDEVLEHAFEPFFTTKGVGEGSGLGLSMVYGFVKQTGGQIWIDSSNGLGTTIKLYLPRAEGTAVQVSQEKTEVESKGHGESILVLEDDPKVREVALSMLESLGYEVLEARDGKAALEILDQVPQIDLLLSDMVLRGGMSGPRAAEIAKLRHPAIRILFMSGYAEKAIRRDFPTDQGVGLLRKPFRKHQLAQKVRAALSENPDRQSSVIPIASYRRSGSLQ